MLQPRGIQDSNSILHDKQVQENIKIAYSMAPIRIQLHNQRLVILWDRVRHYMRRLGVIVDPEANCIPRTRTVVAALISLAVFFVVGGLAIKFPSKAWLPIAYFVATSLDLLIAAFALTDLIPRQHRLYRRNVANTVLTCFFTILTMTVLYAKEWHAASNSWIVTTSSEKINRAPWPAVLIMSDTAAKYQASFLEHQTWTCFIGQAISDAPACSSMDEAEIAQIQTNSCNCSESYDQTIYDHFIANDTKRTISFMSPSYLVTGDVQTFFNLQVTFNYNSSRWGAEGSTPRASPNIWLLVYDPVIPAQEAYETGTAGLTLLNANGYTTITLTPNYIRRRDSKPHYEYNAQVNTSPMLDVVCDVATRNMSSANETVKTPESNAYAPCHAPIAFRFGDLQRQTATERPAMQWGDIVMSVGSYFALVQFVCWVFSGLAWSGAI